MPTYEYRCKSCGHRFEQMQKISADPLLDCPECKEPQLQRLVNATAFHLKGSGWYKTDYASGGKGSTEGGTGKSVSSGATTSANGDSAASGSSESTSSKDTSSGESKTKATSETSSSKID